MPHPRETNERPRRSQSRRRRERKPEQSISSSQIVVYNSPAQAQDREVSSPIINKPPKRGRGLKIRSGDVRVTYKVLPIVIGTGSFGTVRSCIHRESRTKLAIKSIAMKGKAANAALLKNEIALLQQVNHRNVVRVVDVVQDREYIHIVMEQCKGGDLFDKIVDGGARLGEQRASEIIGSLLDAIAYLHDRNIVHRDLKAEHIMLSHDDVNSSPVKIIDFGLATTHDPRDPPMTAFAGSAFTVAPEVVKRSYGKECDLWSVGVIAYFLLTQKMPFNAKSDKEIFQKIVSGDYGYPQWTEKGLSEEAKDFIDRLLVVDPKRRLTAKQAFSHLWIRKHNHTSLVGSMNSHEHLALVPETEKAIVVRRKPNEQRGPVRHESRQRRHESRANGMTSRMNPRQSPTPATAVGGVTSRRNPRRSRQEPVGRAA